MSSGMPDWLTELAAQSEDSGDVAGQFAPDSDAMGGDIGDLDDLRSQIEASDSFSMDEDSGDSDQSRSSSKKSKKSRRSSKVKGVLAMQRFVLATLLFFNVAVIGFIFMIILGRFAF